MISSWQSHPPINIRERHHPTNKTSLENEHCSDNEPKLPCTESPQSPTSTGIRSTEMLSCSPHQEWLSWLPWRMCTGEEAPTEGHDLLPASSGLPQALQHQGSVAATTNLCLQTLLLPCKNSISSPSALSTNTACLFIGRMGQKLHIKSIVTSRKAPQKEWDTASHQLLTVFISLSLPSTQPLSPSSSSLSRLHLRNNLFCTARKTGRWEQANQIPIPTATDTQFRRCYCLEPAEYSQGNGKITKYPLSALRYNLIDNWLQWTVQAVHEGIYKVLWVLAVQTPKWWQAWEILHFLGSRQTHHCSLWHVLQLASKAAPSCQGMHLHFLCCKKCFSLKNVYP